jgi:hypothetical protein
MRGQLSEKSAASDIEKARFCATFSFFENWTKHGLDPEPEPESDLEPEPEPEPKLSQSRNRNKSLRLCNTGASNLEVPLHKPKAEKITNP